MAGNKEFGERLRQLREERKRSNPAFSLRKFAKDVGISATFLSKIERGKFDPPKADRIITMAELLGVDPDELLALANKVDPELNEIIREQPVALADFLRTTQGMSAEELMKITAHAKRMQRQTEDQQPEDADTGDDANDV